MEVASWGAVFGRKARILPAPSADQAARRQIQPVRAQNPPPDAGVVHVSCHPVQHRDCQLRRVLRPRLPGLPPHHSLSRLPHCRGAVDARPQPVQVGLDGEGKGYGDQVPPASILCEPLEPSALRLLHPPHPVHLPGSVRPLRGGGPRRLRLPAEDGGDISGAGDHRTLPVGPTASGPPDPAQVRGSDVHHRLHHARDHQKHGHHRGLVPFVCLRHDLPAHRPIPGGFLREYPPARTDCSRGCRFEGLPAVGLGARLAPRHDLHGADFAAQHPLRPAELQLPVAARQPGLLCDAQARTNLLRDGVRPSLRVPPSLLRQFGVRQALGAGARGHGALGRDPRC
mmetsp:Transcript_10474/g.25737  ORF Transcript_10474/g.25737 Transcript_10474/m.25737 type:complete len:341 (+) Transcript_10474:4241-5263(+)